MTRNEAVEDARRWTLEQPLSTLAVVTCLQFVHELFTTRYKIRR